MGAETETRSDPTYELARRVRRLPPRDQDQISALVDAALRAQGKDDRPIGGGYGPSAAAPDHAMTAMKPLPAPVQAHGIGWAVKQLNYGSRVSRRGWNGKDMWLALQVPDEHSKMGLPYVYICAVTGQLVPWLCSQTDLLARDWVVVK